jgi:hypothetical protein
MYNVSSSFHRIEKYYIKHQTRTDSVIYRSNEMFTSLSVIKDVGSIGGHVITNTNREEILDWIKHCLLSQHYSPVSTSDVS